MKTIKYYEGRRAKIIRLLEIPCISKDYKNMLEKARDFVTEKIQKLQNIADN